ncbi:hypothetical protein, partial [Chryseobacterium sp. SIMBA_029]|uniref:hypothetical protein n=1 Tax=Chryseobacterium sp. SIMBA_029 TaxID=3085772 RepID=UPI00397E44C0
AFYAFRTGRSWAPVNLDQQTGLTELERTYADQTRNPFMLWIKNPLGIFTANDLDAGNGLVIDGGKIVELVPPGGQPASYTSVFDASGHVVLPG